MKKSIDLFLVDIILHPNKVSGDQSGAEFAQNMRKLKKYLFTPIIFITSLYDPKLYLFKKIQCYSFIEKPYDPGKVKETIETAIQYETEDYRKKVLFFHVDGILEAVAVGEIVYAVYQERKMKLVTIHETKEIPFKTCRALLEDLNSENFVKCNRNTIINLDYIKKVDSVNRYIELKECDAVLEIGSVMKKKFMDYVRQRFPILY